jgi:hypothetical protein
MMQQRIHDAGYSMILVWIDRSQPATRSKHFVRSGLQPSDFLAIITHEEDQLADTVAAVVAVYTAVTDPASDLIALMSGLEFGVLLEDALADALIAALGTTYLRSSGLPDTKLKVDKFKQSETIRAAGLDDVEAFLESKGKKFKTVVKPQTGAGSRRSLLNVPSMVKAVFQSSSRPRPKSFRIARSLPAPRRLLKYRKILRGFPRRNDWQNRRPCVGTLHSYFTSEA